MTEEEKLLMVVVWLKEPMTEGPDLIREFTSSLKPAAWSFKSLILKLRDTSTHLRRFHTTQTRHEEAASGRPSVCGWISSPASFRLVTFQHSSFTERSLLSKNNPWFFNSCFQLTLSSGVCRKLVGSGLAFSCPGWLWRIRDCWWTWTEIAEIEPVAVELQNSDRLRPHSRADHWVSGGWGLTLSMDHQGRSELSSIDATTHKGKK